MWLKTPSEQCLLRWSKTACDPEDTSHALHTAGQGSPCTPRALKWHQTRHELLTLCHKPLQPALSHLHTRTYTAIQMPCISHQTPQSVILWLHRGLSKQWLPPLSQSGGRPWCWGSQPPMSRGRSWAVLQTFLRAGLPGKGRVTCSQLLQGKTRQDLPAPSHPTWPLELVPLWPLLWGGKAIPAHTIFLTPGRAQSSSEPLFVKSTSLGHILYETLRLLGPVASSALSCALPKAFSPFANPLS